jgi:hypothetical protein
MPFDALAHGIRRVRDPLGGRTVNPSPRRDVVQQFVPLALQEPEIERALRREVVLHTGFVTPARQAISSSDAA